MISALKESSVLFFKLSSKLSDLAFKSCKSIEKLETIREKGCELVSLTILLTIFKFRKQSES
jgi:hypothetical protein